MPNIPMSSADPGVRTLWTRVVVAMLLASTGAVAMAMRVPRAEVAEVNAGLFSEDALVRPPEVVDCTLDNGAPARCVRLVVTHLPAHLTIGPFCPSTTNDAGGIWNWDGPRAGLYRVNGDFLRMLQGLGYAFYGPDGRVHVADPGQGPPDTVNACLEAALDKTVTMTILLPRTPVLAQRATRLGVVNKVGLALDGVPIFSDAPSVLQTGHMPALDTCGGHVDPGGWYHWHTTSTDIASVYVREHVNADCALRQAPDALFGYAFDGVAIYGSADQDRTVPTTLDACNGHVAPTRDDPSGSYHYHAALSFPNLPGCLSGVQARDNFITTAKTGIGSRQGGGRPGGSPPPGRGQGPGAGPGRLPPGFAEAARILGVSEQALVTAVQDHGGRHLDVAAAARALGVSEAALRAALPPPPPE